MLFHLKGKKLNFIIIKGKNLKFIIVKGINSNFITVKLFVPVLHVKKVFGLTSVLSYVVGLDGYFSNRI